MYGFIQKFADKGKVVMILMRDGIFTADKNNVAIINKGKLKLLDGNPVARYNISDFESEYSKLLNKR